EFNMKVDIWQETKYKTNAANDGVAILICSRPFSSDLVRSRLFSSIFIHSHTMAEAVGFLIALS
ncbi:MAG: hypothetical protein LBJ36_11720, partial [Synergistaceae bacterium]|nr:hypothetical protein [Synergistaceae bacterium]